MNPEPSHLDPVETAPLEELRSLQQARLSALVDRLLEVGGLQGDRLKDAGITAGAQVTLADLGALPTTSKQDLWGNYPFGLVAVPAEEVVVVHGSSGTGGRPTLVAYTKKDIELWSQVCARALAAAGAGPGSLIHNAYGYGLFTGGLGIHQGAIALGATVLPMSGGMTARQVRLIADLRPQVLTCTPSFALHLGEVLQEEGIDTSSLQAGIFGAEPWTDSMRGQIEALLGLKALDIYGLSEVIGPGVASECLEQAGLHVAEDHFIVEAVDPGTGLPVADGEVGELVFTTPTKEALPLLRYRTGDLARLDRGRCDCGRTLVRMSKIVGRRDDMLVIRGVNIYPSEIEAVLLAQPGVGAHYQLVVDRRTSQTELIVAAELAPGATVDARLLERDLRERLALRAQVALLEPGSIVRTEVGKATRVLTWEEGPPPLRTLE